LEAGRYQEAERLARRLMEWAQGPLQENQRMLAAACNTLGTVYRRQGRYAEAETLLKRALELVERPEADPELRYRAFWLYADLLWETDRQAEAVTHLERALQSIDRLRGQAGAEELHRAIFFETMFYPFELMVSWQTELGNAAEVFSAMERSRARTLLEQMATAGLDVLAGLEPQEAERLRRAEAEAMAQVATLRKQLELLSDRQDLSQAEKQQEAQRLEWELRSAQADYVEARAAVRNASPAYRLAVAQD